jgi:hypothetical protein
MKLVPSPQCTYCKETDDIRHFFLFCPRERSFWKSFINWWNHLGDIIIPEQYDSLEESILFGFQAEGGTFTVLNYCILLAKYHIYCQRIHNDNAVDLFQYLIELKNKLNIERNICTSNNSVDKFQLFNFLVEQLG